MVPFVKKMDISIHTPIFFLKSEIPQVYLQGSELKKIMTGGNFLF